MPASTTTEALADSPFVCECGEESRSACAGEPFYQSHEGKRYCVLHFPGREKSASFNEALKRKLGIFNFNFRGVWFPDKLSFGHFHFVASMEADFTRATFAAEVDFSSTTFSHEADFRYAEFRDKVFFSFAKFNGEADFRDATFAAEVDFSNANFGSFAYFTRVRFGADVTFQATLFSTRVFFTNTIFCARANFTFTSFGERAYFMKTTIKAKAYFTYTSFESYVLFSGSEDQHEFCENTSLDFQFARIERPERISFHTLTLRPHWFVNIDTRKLDFTNINWVWRDISIAREVERLKSKKISSPHRLLAVVYRHLAFNAEENHRYEEASRFRYMAMDARRLEKWRGFAPWLLSWWYWLASGYGERILRAFVVFVVLWLLCALLYTQVGFARWEPRRSNEREAATEQRDEVGEPLKLPRALTYSLGVMTLQKPEPRPATMAAQSFVILETILGPVQAALLALAIRRKFMR
jgi:uncharacterized protein YjbI with pentapeptide repeats